MVDFAEKTKVLAPSDAVRRSGGQEDVLPRPTVKDLAKAAGVSLATVDRVLNERPNVSERTVRKVQEAIDRIDFVRNVAAVNLARGKTYRFLFVLPEAGDQYMNEVVKEIRTADQALRSDGVLADTLRVASEDPHAVAKALSELKASHTDGVAIMAPESPQVRDAVARLTERGIRAVRFMSGKEHHDAVDVVGINNVAAGATAARLLGRFCGSRSGKIMLLTETLRARDSIERRLGFDAVINAEFSNLHVLPSLETHTDLARTRQIVARTLRYNDVVAVYVMGNEARMPLTSVRDYLDLQHVVVVAHERTPYTVEGLQTGLIDAIIAQNPGHAVRSAIRLLRARAENRAPVTSQETLRIEILLKDNL